MCADFAYEFEVRVSEERTVKDCQLSDSCLHFAKEELGCNLSWAQQQKQTEANASI